MKKIASIMNTSAEEADIPVTIIATVCRITPDSTSQTHRACNGRARKAQTQFLVNNL